MKAAKTSMVARVALALIVSPIVLLIIAARLVTKSFIPSEQWGFYGFWLSIVTGVVFGVVMVWLCRAGLLGSTPNGQKTSKVAFLIFAPIFSAALWIALVPGLGAVVTVADGESATEIFSMHKRASYSNCLIIEPSEKRFCVPQATADDFPLRAEVALTGKKSWFGFVPKTAEVVSKGSK
ncbi:MAG: hypothetical protein ACAH80_16295 [Alphaproteobacteria bacterium]